MHSSQNGTRCRDGVNVVVSFPSCLAGFFYCFLEEVKEKRGRQGEDAWSVEYETWNCVVHKEQSEIVNFVFTWFTSPSKAS